MDKDIKCSIIIYDDFNNVLIAEMGKGKRKSPEVWCVIGKVMKGKETEEKCITKAIDKGLKCNIFDLEPFKKYVLDGENGNILSVYSGKIREAVNCHKDINKIKWITESDVDRYAFSIQDREALSDFFRR
jgi:hypothetical protein